MPTEKRTLLSVTEAAKELGMSPNTLRKLADAGTIKAVRLPGSGYRRFEPEEIERTRRSMGFDGERSEG
jgi:excisionase family DNA binding protein